MIWEARPEHWPLVQPLLARWQAARYGTMSIDEVLACLSRGELTLWVLQRDDKVLAVFATRVSLADKGNSLEVPVMVGSGLASWKAELDEHFTRLAKADHCTRILITGRRGWAKVAAKASTPPGYRVVGVVIAKEID